MLANVANSHPDLWNLYKNSDNTSPAQNMKECTEEVQKSISDEAYVQLLHRRDEVLTELIELQTRLSNLRQEEWLISTRLQNHFASFNVIQSNSAKESSIKTTSYPLSLQLRQQLAELTDNYSTCKKNMTRAIPLIEMSSGFEHANQLPVKSDENDATVEAARTIDRRRCKRRNGMTPVAIRKTEIEDKHDAYLNKLQVDYAVVNQLYNVNKSRAQETKRDAYRKAYKDNEKKLKQLICDIDEVKSLKSVNTSADSLMSSKSKRLSFPLKITKSSKKARQSLWPIINNIWPFKQAENNSFSSCTGRLDGNENNCSENIVMQRTSSLLHFVDKEKMLLDYQEGISQRRIRSNSFTCENDCLFKIPMDFPQRIPLNHIKRPMSTALCSETFITKPPLPQHRVEHHKDCIFTIAAQNKKMINSNTGVMIGGSSRSSSGCSCLSSQSSQLSTFHTKSSISTNTYESMNQTYLLENDSIYGHSKFETTLNSQTYQPEESSKVKKSIRKSLRTPLQLTKAFRRRLSMGQNLWPNHKSVAITVTK